MRIVLAVLLLCVAAAARAAPDAQDWSEIARGRYLVQMGDCQACHTAPGGAPFSGGRAIETPFGTVMSANITPDADTGIGAWSDDEFVDTLQKGRGRNGMRIYPAMPYTYTARVTRTDALAMRAFLATLPPVRRSVDRDTLPFPLNIRAFMGVWNLLFFREGSFHPDPQRSADWNRGAYLVTGIEHCGMCHTAKNILGGDVTSAAVQGARLQGWYAPDLTPDPRRGIGNWSKADLANYLRTGHNRFASASGPMGEEVEISSSGETPSDLHAIATYLRSVKASDDTATPLAVDVPAMRRGGAIYADLCSACHTSGGRGIAGLFPQLAGGAAIQQPDPTSTVRVILRGAISASTAGAPTGPGMPSFGWDLDDREVASVATFIRNAWGNAAPEVTPAFVARERASLARRPD